MKDLQGKVAVITGAASGIGRAMTDRFIAAGMKIVLADVDEIKLRNVEAELTENGAEVFPVTVDVSLGESVEELARKTLEKYGAAHVLCNNAGVAGVGDQWTGPMSVWDWVINIGQNDLHTRSDETIGHSAADTARCASDDCHLAL